MPHYRGRLPGWLTLAVVQGVSAPLIYLGVIAVGGAMRPGYSHLNQAVSELTEAGAPDRVPLSIALAAMEVCSIAFGLGYFALVHRLDRRLAASAGLMAVIGVIGLGFARFPMDPVGNAITFDGLMHLGIVTVSALAAIASVLLAWLGWRRVPAARALAVASFAVLAVMLTSGVISGYVGVNAAAGIGLWQRINTGAFGLWQIATAVFLLRHGADLVRPGRS